MGYYLGLGVYRRYCLPLFKYTLDLYKRLGDSVVLYLVGQAGVGPLEEGEEGLDFRDFIALVGG